MPYIRIWVHLVWSTKHREPLLVESIRPKVFAHIAKNAKAKGIYLDAVGGYNDHVHCLISLGSAQTIAKVAQLIKGESAFWINKHQLTPKKLLWQAEYFAVSVSESIVDRVRKYIHRQEEHHRRKTFEEEYEEFMEKYNFEGLG